MDKHPQLISALDRLRAQLGTGAFDVVDHWSADLLAVGVASPCDHGILTYISVMPSGGYYVELEEPSEVGDDFPYRVVGTHHDLPFDAMAKVVAEHLSRGQTDRAG